MISVSTVIEQVETVVSNCARKMIKISVIAEKSKHQKLREVISKVTFMAVESYCGFNIHQAEDQGVNETECIEKCAFLNLLETF